MGVWRAFMKEEFKWRKHVCKRNVKGSPKMKHWSNDYPEFWPRQEGWKSKQKQCDRKEPVTVKQFALQSNCVGDGAIYSRLPNCCERKWAVDRAVTDHGDLTVKIRNRWTEKFPDENAYHRRQGYLPKLVTKSMRCPRRLRVPSLNKIAQTVVRPSPLWEFRAANCFRDLIAKLQNENPRRTAVV